MSLQEHLTQKNVGIAAAGAGVFATLIGTYVQFRGDPTPTENILDDVRAMQADCQKDKAAWRDLLADEAAELKSCRAENSKLKEFEDRISKLEDASIYNWEDSHYMQDNRKVVGHHLDNNDGIDH